MGHWVLNMSLEGCPVTIRLGRGSLVVALDPNLVVACDLQGRPWRIVDGETTLRWGLDGRVLRVGRAEDGHRILTSLAQTEAEEIWVNIRRRLAAILRGPTEWEAQELSPVPGPGETRDSVWVSRSDVLGAIHRFALWDRAALRRDAQEYAALYSPVGVLPPDLYQALVVQVTQGCSFNSCTFCGLYRQVRFKVRTVQELESHLDDVDRFLGRGTALRRSVFLGDANALTLDTTELTALLKTVANHHRARLDAGEGIYSFLDAFTGSRKQTPDYQIFKGLGLKGVCIGMESGHDPLLRWLRKPGTAADVAATIGRIKDAELQVSVVVLLGAGGRKYDAGHVEDTTRLLSELPLDDRDRVFFSDLVASDGSPYLEQALRDGIETLSHEDRLMQNQAMAKGLRPYRTGGPLQAVYDIREFTY